VEELRRSELDLALEAGNAYFNALLAKAAVQIRNQNLAATRQNLRIAEENYAAGQSGRGDVLRLESEAAQDLQAFLEAVTQFRQSLHVVNRLLNQPIGRRIDVQEISVEGGMPRASDAMQFRQILDDPVLRSDFEEFLVQEAIDIAPELEALDHTLDATSRIVRLNGLERYLPTVAGGVELNHTFDQWGKGTPAPGTALDQYYAVGFRASIPVFDSNLRRVDRQRARIQAEQLQTDREAAADLIEQRVRDIVLETMNQLASLELAVVSAEAAAESLELAQASYTEGALTLVELLDVQTNHLNAELSLAASTYTLLATTLAVQRLVGHYFILSSEAENQAFMERFLAFRAARMQ
jgi:outer membrane protein TolC